MRMLTVKDVARRWKCPASTVRAHIRSGLRATRTGRNYLVSIDEVVRWERSDLERIAGALALSGAAQTASASGTLSNPFVSLTVTLRRRDGSQVRSEWMLDADSASEGS